MKVYQINVVCGFGSTGRIVVDLQNVIIKNHGDCKIAYGRGDSPKHVNAIRISNKSDIYFHAVMTRLTDKHALYSKFSTRKLINDIKKYSPDIIHLHNIHGYYLNYKLLFSFLKEYRKPVVWTMHDCWAFTGHCAHYSPIDCTKWKEGCYECGLLHTYPETIGKGNVVSNYQMKKEIFSELDNLHIVTPSMWLKEQLKQSFLKNKQITVIHNGIDLSRFKRVPTKRRDKKRILGVASVWNKEKGIEDIFALRKLLPVDYEICLVGLNEKQFKSLPEGIVGISRTKSIRELVEYYSGADVFINFTYADTFPTVNIEALACGTPILSYDTGGSPEIVEDCGWVVPKGDTRQAAEILIEYERSDMLRERCVKRAQQFNIDYCYKQYISLYKEIMEKNG